MINNKNGSRKKATLPDINTKPEFVRSQSFTQINGVDGASGESSQEHSTKMELHKSDEFCHLVSHNDSNQMPNWQSRRKVFKLFLIIGLVRIILKTVDSLRGRGRIKNSPRANFSNLRISVETQQEMQDIASRVRTLDSAGRPTMGCTVPACELYGQVVQSPAPQIKTKLSLKQWRSFDNVERHLR